MKKLAIFLVVVTILLSYIPTVYAAGYGSVSGPSTVRAGDTITVYYNAGGGIYGANGSISYNASQLTLQGYYSHVGGSWQGSFSGNTFLFYDDSLSSPIHGGTIFSAVFTVNANLAPGTQVSVSVSGAVSDGKQDSGAGGSWSATIAPPLSKNCDLSALTLSGASFSPAFSAGTTSYTASVPFSTASVSVNATAADEKATVSISNPALAAGGTTAVTVTVTAENGDTKTYTIRIQREQDPNYIPSSVKTLSSLTVEGQTLSPQFSADVLQYYIWLPYETQTVSISGTATHEKASVTVGQIPQLEPGKATDIPVTVTAEDQSQQVYTVTVFRGPAHADTESFLQGVRPPVQPEPTEPATTPSVSEDAGQEIQTGHSWVLPAVLGLAVGVALTLLTTTLLRKKR